jgi:hypothetical protein
MWVRPRGAVNRACRILLAGEIEGRKRRPSVIVWSKRFWTLCLRLATSLPHINQGIIVVGSYYGKCVSPATWMPEIERPITCFIVYKEGPEEGVQICLVIRFELGFDPVAEM